MNREVVNRCRELMESDRMLSLDISSNTYEEYTYTLHKDGEELYESPNAWCVEAFLLGYLRRGE